MAGSLQYQHRMPTYHWIEQGMLLQVNESNAIIGLQQLQSLWRSLRNLSNSLLREITLGKIDTIDFSLIFDDANCIDAGFSMESHAKNSMFVAKVEKLLLEIIAGHDIFLPGQDLHLGVDNIPVLNSSSKIVDLLKQWKSVITLIIHIGAGPVMRATEAVSILKVNDGLSSRNIFRVGGGLVCMVTGYTKTKSTDKVARYDRFLISPRFYPKYFSTSIIAEILIIQRLEFAIYRQRPIPQLHTENGRIMSVERYRSIVLENYRALFPMENATRISITHTNIRGIHEAFIIESNCWEESKKIVAPSHVYRQSNHSVQTSQEFYAPQQSEVQRMTSYDYNTFLSCSKVLLIIYSRRLGPSLRLILLKVNILQIIERSLRYLGKSILFKLFAKSWMFQSSRTG